MISPQIDFKNRFVDVFQKRRQGDNFPARIARVLLFTVFTFVFFEMLGDFPEQHEFVPKPTAIQFRFNSGDNIFMGHSFNGKG